MTSHTTLHTRAAVAAAALLISGLDAVCGEFYLRADVGHSRQVVDYENAGEPAQEWSGDSLTPGVAAGFVFGVQKQHDVNLAVSRSKFTDTSVIQDGAAFDHTTGTFTSVPIVLTYRHVFGVADEPLRVYAGPSLGWTLSKTDFHYREIFRGAVTEAERGSNRNSALTLGGRVGLLWQAGKTTTLDFGYGFARTKFEFVDEGDEYALVLKHHLFSAGLSFAF